MTVKFKIDCDSILIDTENVHRPKPDGDFMAVVDLSCPNNWKNQDTINLSTFTPENLQNNMPILSLSKTIGGKKNWNLLLFSSLIYFSETGEYGANSDSIYSMDFKIKDDILILKEENFSSKGKRRKYKFQILWIGRNCCQLIRLNPLNKNEYPKTLNEQ